MIPELVFSFILVFGLITSYEDYSSNKIRNKWVLMAILFGVVTSIVLHFQGQEPIGGWPFIAEFFINCGFTLIFGYMLWYTGLWSAGDAKLYLAYSFILVPVFYQPAGYITHFPGLNLVVNTFTPFLIFFFVYVLAKSKYSFDLDFIKSILNWKMVLSIAMFVFGFGWVLKLIFGILGIPSNFLLVVVTLFFIIIIATRFLKVKLLYLNILLVILRLVFDLEYVLTIAYLKRFVMLIILFLILRFYLLSLSYKVFSKEIFIEDLKRGMIPAEDVVKVDKGKYKKNKFAYFSFIDALLRKSEGKSMLSFVGDGITNKEAAFIRKIHSKGFLKDHTIRIFQTIPFAPFMFLGALITLFFGTNIFFIIRYLIETFI